ncbi:hypothetical protein [Polaromonas sp. CG9_12]|nr:hypothetical protein [Polaromonas sp. CG9_12]CDS53462.1 hypothetical protein [Polaromonas sp. CG9_12]
MHSFPQGRVQRIRSAMPKKMRSASRALNNYKIQAKKSFALVQ